MIGPVEGLTSLTVRDEASGDSTEVATTQLLTATDILYGNELRRGRLWVALSGHMAIIGLVSALLIHTPGRTARLLLASGCGVLLVAALIAWGILRRRDHYSSAEAAFYGYLSLVAVLPAYYFYGWFSPVLVVVCLGGIIFAMGHSTRAVLVMAAATAGTHLAMGGLTISGSLADVGIAGMHVDDSSRAVLVLIGSQALVVFAFVIGRQLRAHSLDGVERYGEAVRESTRRQVLLQEAIDELHRARKVGDPGRFTDLELGSFRLGVVLGRGGMGEVYQATHLRSGASAAVKVLTAGRHNEHGARRFEREIELVAALESRHVVRVLEHSAPGDPMPYLAMERLEGTTLSEQLREHLSIRGALRMLREIAEAVDAAHEAGVIHRDLKPQNIFHHTGDGEDIWKVLDFGVSRLVDRESSLTGLGLVGTPSYMSPEQAAGRSLTTRSDLFSLGCIAYRCLTGHRAFSRPDTRDILRAIVGEMPVRPSAITPLPREVDLVLAIALAKDPDSRFGSAFALASALTTACGAGIPSKLHRRAEALQRRFPWTEA
jgi:serine/threonine-protein kinase